jgi:hypothetical protein
MNAYRMTSSLYQYRYFEILCTYVPLLLAAENFFKSALMHPARKNAPHLVPGVHPYQN